MENSLSRVFTALNSYVFLMTPLKAAKAAPALQIHRSALSRDLPAWAARVSSLTLPARLHRPLSPLVTHRLSHSCTADLRVRSRSAAVTEEHRTRFLQQVHTGMDTGGENWPSRNHAYCPRWQRETFHRLFFTPMRMFSGERVLWVGNIATYDENEELGSLL